VDKRGSRQAGIELEQHLSEELLRLGIPNSLTRGNPDNIEERVDLRIPAPPFTGQPDFEFQLTLKQGIRRKMREFVLAALKNPIRGVRIYLEVAASHWDDLSYIARRVAHAIKDIIHRWKRFEPHDVQGVRIRVGRPRQPYIERFSLLERVGKWAFEAFDHYLEHVRAEKEAQRQQHLDEVRLRREQVKIIRAKRAQAQKLYPPSKPSPVRNTFTVLPQREQLARMNPRLFVPLRRP